MSWVFEHIENSIDPTLVRELSKLGDEALKLGIAAMVCSIAGGLREVPSKAHKTEVARRLVREGKEKMDVINLTGISTKQFYIIRKELTNG